MGTTIDLPVYSDHDLLAFVIGDYSLYTCGSYGVSNSLMGTMPNRNHDQHYSPSETCSIYLTLWEPWPVYLCIWEPWPVK